MNSVQPSDLNTFVIPSTYLKLIEEQLVFLNGLFDSLIDKGETRIATINKSGSLNVKESWIENTKEQIHHEDILSVVNTCSKIVKFYNFAVIQGEYYSDSCANFVRNQRTFLSSFKLFLEITIFKYYILDVNRFEFIQGEFSVLNEHFQYFDYLSSKISSRIDQNLNQIIDNDLFDKISSHRNFIEIKSDERILRFLINVRIAELDEGYICNSSRRNELTKLISLLEELDQRGSISRDSITKILIVKSKFLLLKLLRRLKNNRGIETTYGLNHYSFDITSLEKNIRESNIIFISDFIDDINNHYHNSNIYDYKKLNKEIFSVRLVHKNCKYIKKQLEAGDLSKNKTEELLKCTIDDLNWIKKLIKENPKIKNRSNWYAYISSESLLNNTFFKIKCFQFITQKTKLQEIVSDFDSINKLYSKLSTEENAKDCFQIDLIYSNFLRDLLNIILTKITSEIDFGNLVKCVDAIVLQFLKTAEKLEAHLATNTELSLMPLYLLMSECYGKFTIQDSEKKEEILIFIDSSYILPSDYSNLLKIKSEISSEISRISTAIHLKIATQRESLFESKLKENQFQIIQVIGLYAAIITFILTSLSTASKFQFSKIELLMFMIVFVFCISVFVLLLRAIFSGIVKVTIFAIFSAILLFLSIWSIFSLNSNAQLIESKQRELDTLRIKKQKVLVLDSIEKIEEKKRRKK